MATGTSWSSSSAGEARSNQAQKMQAAETRFKLVTASDEDLLLDLMREFYVIEHLPFDEPVARAALRELSSQAHLGRLYLIRSGGETAGYIVLTFGFSLEFHGRDALVDELYLREQFRGKGLGRESLEFVEAVCRQEGIRAVHLEVDHVNVRAQEVYRKAGYRDHDRHLLTKWLSSA